jgi:hypothetical protein
MIAPEIILFPYIKLPETGSRMPSMSTGGLAMNLIINTLVAVSSVGIIISGVGIGRIIEPPSERNTKTTFHDALLPTLTLNQSRTIQLDWYCIN